MTPEEWQRRWVGVLTLSGYERDEAESAFESVFRDLSPDLNNDPADTALAYVFARPARHARPTKK